MMVFIDRTDVIFIVLSKIIAKKETILAEIGKTGKCRVNGVLDKESFMVKLSSESENVFGVCLFLTRKFFITR